MSDLKALLPCPFCGLMPIFEAEDHVSCGEVGCPASFGESSVEQWNTRTPTAPAKVEGVGMTPELNERQINFLMPEEYSSDGAWAHIDNHHLRKLCRMALRGLDAGTRGE